MFNVREDIMALARLATTRSHSANLWLVTSLPLIPGSDGAIIIWPLVAIVPSLLFVVCSSC
jgi:hypothetical protein